MSHRVARRLLTSICNLGLLLVFANLSQGCGSGSSAPPTSRDVTGHWYYSNPTLPDQLSISMDLTQSGNSVTGTQITSAFVIPPTTQAQVTGQINGATITLNMVYSDGTTGTFSGSIQNGTKISGTWGASGPSGVSPLSIVLIKSIAQP